MTEDRAERAPRQATSAELAAQIRRRRAAADRCEPLDDGRRDPLLTRTDDELITPRELAAWRTAVRHLRAHGLDVLGTKERPLELLPAAVRTALLREAV